MNRDYDVTLGPRVAGPPGGPGGPPEGEWNNTDVRGAIYAMSGKVCTYCQRDVSLDRGDVEHFRPKAIYRWLQYDFANYYLSCSVCNRQTKQSRFPLEPDAPLATFANAMASDDTERRLLLDPCIDDVEDWLRVNWKDDLVPVKSRDGISPQAENRVVETIDFFLLNTDPDVVKDRQEAVGKALELIDEAIGGDQGARDRLLAMANRYKPYGAVIRQMIADSTSIRLPTFDEELRWHVAKILEDIVLAERLRAQAVNPTRRVKDRQKRKIDEAYWSLAVLIKDPPGDPPIDIRRWVDSLPDNRIDDYLVQL